MPLLNLWGHPVHGGVNLGVLGAGAQPVDEMVKEHQGSAFTASPQLIDLPAHYPVNDVSVSLLDARLR